MAFEGGEGFGGAGHGGYEVEPALIREHGEDAELEAAMRADAMLEKGDLDGYAVWRRVLWAVEELQGTEALGPVDNYLSQTIMQAMQIMDMKAWAVLS